MDTSQGQTEPQQHDVSIEKVQTFLRAKDDTQRFVGLALLKALLDNSSELRDDKSVLKEVWASISTRFLDRLLLTGSKRHKANSQDMLSLAISVLHTFSILLPEETVRKPKFADRIPALIDGILYSSPETANLALRTIFTLTSFEEGAVVLIEKEDLSPLTEVAHTHPIVLDIVRYAILNSMTKAADREAYAGKLEAILQNLVASFTGTDAVILLDFLGDLFHQALPQILPPEPRWLQNTINYIQKLVFSRPTAKSRAAYTKAAASLLQIYPDLCPPLLFVEDKVSEKPFAYFFINLLLIDIRSSAPMLLEKLNDPEYPQMSSHLASAFDVICIFIGYLLRCLEDDSRESLIMPADSLLKLRKSISETMSVTIEYLRDRWDASVAGAMGLHPDARRGAATTSVGSRYTLTWDSMKHGVDDDPLILSATRSLGLWLREEDNDLLRKEATGLTDMFLDLYQVSYTEKLDFRSPILVALEALTSVDQGRQILLSQNGWQTLTGDLTGILQSPSHIIEEAQATRGIDIIRVLMNLVEQSATGTEENWMNLITTAAATDMGEVPQTHSAIVMEFQVAVLQLCSVLLVHATVGMRGRFQHSIIAINGITNCVSHSIEGDIVLKGSIDDVSTVLSTLLRKG